MFCKIFAYIVLFFRAALEENPYFRLKKVVKWYLSGFYKKPKVMFVLLSIALYVFFILYVIFRLFINNCIAGPLSVSRIAKYLVI